MFQDNPKIELKRVQMLSSMKTPEEVKQEALKAGFRVAGPDEQIQVAIFRNAAPEKDLKSLAPAGGILEESGWVSKRH